MNPHDECYEIVSIILDFWLIDAKSHPHRYSTHHGYPLAPGYYVVNWPDTIKVRHFNEQAEFTGPFTLLQEAQVVRERLHQKQERIKMRLSEQYGSPESEWTSVGVCSEPPLAEALVGNTDSNVNVGLDHELGQTGADYAGCHENQEL